MSRSFSFPGGAPDPPSGTDRTEDELTAPSLPAVTLPRAGGAVRGLGETFATNPVTGSASLTVPLASSTGRGGVGPGLALSYDSAAGQSTFGYGWRLNLASISRRTDRRLPRYADAEDSDTFLLSDTEDLVPLLTAEDGDWKVDEHTRTVDGTTFRVRRYRPRAEGGFARIERWTNVADGADVRWRTISRDNVTAWYGRDDDSRVRDPRDHRRVFSWLISLSHDDKGNAVLFEYRREDGAGVDAGVAHEAHRDATDRSAALHLKRVRYGNTTPYRPRLAADAPDPLPGEWHFQLVLDYGEHDPEAPTPDDPGPWSVRADPYSSYRSGFEVRTYRLCRRVLMFHRFPELGPADRLVSSTDLSHRVDGYTFLAAVSRRGYDHDGARYSSAALPALELDYQPSEIDPRTYEVHRADAPPYGLDGRTYTWGDLDGDGAAGVLAQAEGAWYFLRNLSPLQLGPDGRRQAVFAPARAVPELPSDALPGTLTSLLLDLDGSGRPELVRLDAPVPGAARTREDGAWTGVTPFASSPTATWRTGQLRLADLTGDGRPDLVVDDLFGPRWYESLAGEGFAGPRPLTDSASDSDLPRLVYRDDTELVQFADLTGDGLADLVRIRNGAVCYRPNLGHGRFGAPVTMDDAPQLDDPDLFDARRLLLGDVDGSGPVDLLYLAADGVRLYRNQLGNGWGPARRLSGVPGADTIRRAAVVDLLGTGTGCLVWSSPLPADAAAPMRYLDLTSGRRPHLLTGYRNGMGAEVRIEYQPSTWFHLSDERDGRPWPDRLPFPVHCAYRVTTVDHVRETVFVRTSTYHDGWYDPVEHEFRGFGMVESTDTERFDLLAEAGAANATDPDLHRPPVLTRTWYHLGGSTGAGARARRSRRDAYHREPGERELPEPALPPGLSDDEHREAARALRGLPLRSEVYALDGGPDADRPYTVTESTYRVRLVQPRGGNPYACFLVSPAESVGYAYDRDPADPRVSHTMVLETDELGLLRRSASVTYPRRRVDPELPEPVRQAQARRHVVYTEHDYTGDVVGPDAHRLRVAHDIREHELTGLATAAGDWLTPADVDAAVAAATPVPYEQLDGPGVRLRLTGRSQAEFLADDLSGPLPPGTLSALGLVDRTYRLALTTGLVGSVYGTDLSAEELAAAGYVARDGGWWVPSGRLEYGADAAERFYLADGFRDAFGLLTTVVRDHELLVREVTDPLGHRTVADNDWRVLGPWRVTDPNGTATSVAFDALGAVVATAVAGSAGEGDTLDDPTSTASYDLTAWRDHGRPNRVLTRTRERHGAADTRWQERWTYLDGSGAPVMTKVPAEPGVARVWNPALGVVEEVDTGDAPRWVGNGRTVLDNKGAPVKQYEPYFSATAEFENEAALVEVGVTPIVRYDPVGRVLRVDLPDGTFTRATYTPWRTRRYDANDTVADSRWFIERGSPTAGEPEPADPQRRAAWLALAHADTPAETHLDALGRAVYSVADNGPGGLRTHRVESDLTGHVVTAFDSRDRRVAETVRDLLGTAIAAETAERGRRWMFTDVAGVAVRVWDDTGRLFRTSFDAVRRPVATTCAQGGAETVVSRIVYGDSHPEAATRHLIGRAHRVYDSAGVAVLDRADFRGRPVELSRRLVHDGVALPDWAGDPEPLLEPETHQVLAAYDALGRPERLTLPDGTVLEPSYDVSGRLNRLRGRVRGVGEFRTFLTGARHDERGRRLESTLGNGLVTRYGYDPVSLRLTRVRTCRPEDPADGEGGLQDLRYVHDPVGNVTEIGDRAQQTRFFANTVVSPDTRFAYDALYQLVRATGREHAGAGQPDHGDLPGVPLPHPNDAAAVRRYTETYDYDDLGNLTRVAHSAGGAGWTRHYRYRHDVDPTDRTNRLLATSLPGDDPDGPYGAGYAYDAVGNMTAMPQVAALSWDVFDRLAEVDLGGGGTARYTYGSAGGRVRAVVTRLGGLRTERRWLGGVERHREWLNGVLRRERWTLHVADEHGRIAQVDTLTVDTAGTDPAPLGVPVVRYQYTNHLGSTALETDEAGAAISYEEYHPFGSTAYRSAAPSSDHSLKRYRYGGKERDDETGLCYFGARYYAPWLGRWISTDPAGFADGANLFAYCRNNPVTLADPSGTQSATDTITRFTAGGGDAATVARLSNPTAEQQQSESFRREVLSFFQTHGYPHLRSLPTWNAAERLWLFPDPVATGGDGDGGGSTGGGSTGAGDAGTGGGSTGSHDGGTAGSGSGGTGDGENGASGSGVGAGGRATVTGNPEGFTLEVPDNFDDEKIAAYRDRIRTDRGVGHRSQPPGGGSRTDDIRDAFEHLVEEFDDANGNLRSRTTNVDHTVELQHIIRRPDEMVRPQDHRYQPSGLNQSQGRSARTVADRQIAAGAPEDVPAGGVARSNAIGRWYNSPGFRTVARRLGYGLMVAGPILTWWGAGGIDNAGVRYGTRGLAVAEGAGVAYYMYGRIVLGGGALGTAAGRAAMSAGGMAAGVAGGAAQALVSGYMAYQDAQRGDWTAFGFDAAAAVGGVALAVGAVVGSPVLLGIGIVTGIAAGVFHLGRYFDWW